jgi:hypothetical protein
LAAILKTAVKFPVGEILDYFSRTPKAQAVALNRSGTMNCRNSTVSGERFQLDGELISTEGETTSLSLGFIK